MKEILITCNSPGEVASWLRVVLPELRKRAPQAKISVALVPCPYATGAEKAVVQKLAGIDELYSPRETMAMTLRGARRQSSGVVLFLGGDPWHALLLAWRFGYRTAGYFGSPSFWSRRFDLPLFERVVGNLMVDGLQSGHPRSRAQLGLSLDRPVLGLFPGSRPIHLRVTLAAYLAMVENMARACPELQFVLIRSPFVDARGLQKAIDNPWSVGLPLCQARVEEDAIVCPSGLRIPITSGLPGEVFSLFDVAMTIPGTNTAELGCCAKPFVVTLHRLAFFGGGGLVSFIEKAPFLPNSWKVKMRERKFARHHGLLSHPNILAGRLVAPEVIVDKDSGPLEAEILRWIGDPEGRARMGFELQTAMGRPGAAARLAEAVVDYLGTV